MFAQHFKTIASTYTSDTLLVDRLWSEIETAYCSNGRHYHNLAHLDNLVTELLQVREQIEDWDTIIFSIAWHDIVYNTLKQDNEEKSAALAYTRLTELGLPSIRKEKCQQQILATKKHQWSDDPDTNYFTDADLSILGCTPRSYATYTRQIRKEYKFYPDFLYKPGRRSVLARFLEMDVIFKTGYFREKYEEQARINIAEELKSL